MSMSVLAVLLAQYLQGFRCCACSEDLGERSSVQHFPCQAMTSIWQKHDNGVAMILSSAGISPVPQECQSYQEDP